MTDNKTLLQKADLALADLTANGGVLLPEQSDSFIRKLIKSPTLLRQARVVTMRSSSTKINKIGFGSRILRKATSATALTQNQRSKPTTEQIQMDSKEVIAEVRLPYDVVEDNIERGNLGLTDAKTGPSGGNVVSGGIQDTIVTMIAERAALDLEELGLKGDTTYTSGDADDQAYMSLFNGFLKLSNSLGNTVDAQGSTISKAVFKAGLKAMPDQYLRNRAAMKQFVSTNNETEYRDTLSDRGTALGDSLVQGNNAVYAYGVPVEAVPMMPEARGLFTNPLNLIYGIQRQVSMEFDKDITARVYIIVLTARVAVQIEETAATVNYTNIG